MKKPKKCAVIGGGGIACVLLPLITRQFDTVIIDADKYTPENSSRQFPALTSIGNKAETLRDMLQPHTLRKISAIPRYLKNTTIANEDAWQGVDFIIGCVDNNSSRRIIIDVAEAYEIPAIIAGNEHNWGEAHMFLPGTYNPLNFHEFPDSDPPPWACNSNQNMEAHPQTILANAMASACASHLMLSYFESPRPRTTVVWSKIDVFNSECLRAKDFLDTPRPAAV